MSYRPRYYNDAYDADMEHHRRRMTGCGCEAPPQHHEMVRVPHHIYTQHRRPIIKRWTTHDVQHRTYPVTQETRQMEHPSEDDCE